MRAIPPIVLTALLVCPSCVNRSSRGGGEDDGEPDPYGDADAAFPRGSFTSDTLAPVSLDAPGDDDVDPDHAEPSRPAPGVWVRIEPGTFAMGSAPDEACHVSANDVRHEVTLTRAYEIQSTEVTQEQYTAMLGANPSSFQDECGPDCPVEMTDWHAAARYCNALSDFTDLEPCYACEGARCTEAVDPSECTGYRLPTEAEWEHAYRAGTTTPIYAGELTVCGSLDPLLDGIAWFLYDGEGQTHPVAAKLPNAWGLFDMSGNVWEWTADGYAEDLSLLPGTDPFTPQTPDDARVMRGGSYNCLPGENRAAHRSGLPSIITGQNVGFRCARSL